MKKIFVALVIVVVVLLGTFLYLNKSHPLSYDQKIQKCNFSIKESEAEFFLASTTDFIFVDQGTAPPPRGLSVYNLNSCSVVFKDQYSRPFDVKGNEVTYWSPVAESVTNTNCPKKSEYESQGLGAGIESYVSLDLTTIKKTVIGESRCGARQ